MKTDLKNKVALITGASRGIGRAIAVALANQGCEVYINYIGNDEKAEETKDIIESNGGKCNLVKADMCLKNCGDIIAKKVKHVDILILNASIQYRKSWCDITTEDFENQINCNLRGPMLLMQKYVPNMIKNGWGRIITIGSVQETKPHADMLVYSASKCALTAMAKSLALQLAQTGVTVNSIAPGVICTDRNTEALSDENYAEIVRAKIPMGYFGKAEDCAEIITTLCSDGARYITGQNIFVDGGMGIM